jgi:hypothetical protein
MKPKLNYFDEFYCPHSVPNLIKIFLSIFGGNMFEKRVLKRAIVHKGKGITEGRRILHKLHNQ